MYLLVTFCGLLAVSSAAVIHVISRDQMQFYVMTTVGPNGQFPTDETSSDGQGQQYAPAAPTQNPGTAQGNPVIAKSCGPPYYWNTEQFQTSFEIGTKITYDCGSAEGMKMYGSSELTCLMSGQWTEPTGTYCSDNAGEDIFKIVIPGAPDADSDSESATESSSKSSSKTEKSKKSRSSKSERISPNQQREKKPEIHPLVKYMLKQKIDNSELYKIFINMMEQQGR